VFRCPASLFVSSTNYKYVWSFCHVAGCLKIGAIVLQLVFIRIHLFVIYLALFFVIVNLHQPIHKAQIYFVFLSVGNPKAVLKGGYVGRKGGSSFANLWFEH
jgi:hypothetical protein